MPFSGIVESLIKFCFHFCKGVHFLSVSQEQKGFPLSVTMETEQQVFHEQLPIETQQKVSVVDVRGNGTKSFPWKNIWLEGIELADRSCKLCFVLWFYLTSWIFIFHAMSSNLQFYHRRLLFECDSRHKSRLFLALFVFVSSHHHFLLMLTRTFNSNDRQMIVLSHTLTFFSFVKLETQVASPTSNESSVFNTVTSHCSSIYKYNKEMMQQIWSSWPSTL